MGIFTIAFTYFGSNTFPSFETMKPSIMPEDTIKAHFFGFKPMPYSQHFSKHLCSLDKCVSKSLKTMKSSKKSFIKSSK